MNSSKELKDFIREHRSNEVNFEKLNAKLEQEIERKQASENYVSVLMKIKTKAAEEYKTAKQAGNNAWPEFEKFVSEFEKAVINEP